LVAPAALELLVDNDRRLVDKGTEFDDEIPLVWAARTGRTTAIRILLGAGVPPGPKSGELGAAGDALQVGHLEVVKMLLAAGLADGSHCGP